MKIKDIENLEEANILHGLKKAGMAGAIAANVGLGYTGYDLARNHSKASAEQIQSQTISPISTIKSATIKSTDSDSSNVSPSNTIRPKLRPDIESASSDVHPSFPKQLMHQKEIDPNTRVQNFIDVILPYIQNENEQILKTRNHIISIMNRAKEKKPISRNEIMKIRDLYQPYGVDNIPDLLTKLDIIPASLALAQGALESGWGSDYLARQGNAFYGQKSWAKTGGVEGPYGERYRAFNSPAESVKAYMFNLNTHNAYAEFRTARANIRKLGKSPTGLELSQYLVKYSTLGNAYVKKVTGLIKGRSLNKYDY